MSFARTVEFYSPSQSILINIIVGRLTHSCSFEPGDVIPEHKTLKIKRRSVMEVDMRSLDESTTHTIELTENVPGEMKYYTADDGDLVVTRRRLRLPAGIPGDDAGCDDQCFHEYLDNLACRHGLVGLDDFDAWRFVQQHYYYTDRYVASTRLDVYVFCVYCRNKQLSAGMGRWTRRDLMYELYGPDACPMDPDDPVLKRRHSVVVPL